MTGAANERVDGAGERPKAGRIARGPGKGVAEGAAGHAARAKGKSGRAKAQSEPRRDALAAELALELGRVRSALKEASEQLVARLDGELAALTLYLNGHSLEEEAPVLPPARVLSQMLAEARDLKVKPKKGRVKDMGRIEALLGSLASRMPPGT
jgi:hypothetical protein